MASRIARAHARMIGLTLGSLVLALSATVHAEPTATEKETARGLMADGRDKRDKNDLKGALKSFEAADSLMHVPSTGWEVARAQEQLGLLVEARDTALRVARIPQAPNEPGAFKEARDKATALGDSLEARIPAVRITVKGAAEGATMTVAIDTITVPSAALATPFKLNPGHHVVSAKTDTAGGKQEIDLAEKETKDVAIVLTAGAPATPDTAESPFANDANPPETPPAEIAPQSHKMRTLAFIGFGVAGAGVIAGTITGLLSMSSTSSAQNGCRNNLCPPSTYSDLDSAHLMATVSTVSFIVAGVGAGVGIVALIVGDKPAERAPTTGTKVTPWIGLGSAGVRGSF
jgi:hypothetical protein